MINVSELVTPDMPLGAFNLLNKSDIYFYLTGSRFFGGSNFDSDWDFFTADHPDTEAWLLENGFEEKFSSNYTDDASIIKVYWLPKYMLEIQLVKDVSLKRDAQDLLRKYRVLVGVPKTVRRIIWSNVMRVLTNEQAG